MAKLTINGNPILGDFAQDVNFQELKEVYGADAQIVVTLIEAELAAQAQAARKAAQVTGVEFEGVMCSATAEDQYGLNAVWTQYALGKMAQQAFSSVCFHFSNGNKLLLTEANVEAFKAAWVPFRMSFFPVPEAE